MVSNDRNIVKFGPSRAPSNYKFKRVEESVADLERRTVNSVADVAQTANDNQIKTGEVVSYDSLTGEGTLDVEGEVVPFVNGSGLYLDEGDTVVSAE